MGSEHVEEIIRKYEALGSYPVLDAESDASTSASLKQVSVPGDAAPGANITNGTASVEVSTTPALAKGELLLDTTHCNEALLTNPLDPQSTSNGNKRKRPLDDLPIISGAAPQAMFQKLLELSAELLEVSDGIKSLQLHSDQLGKMLLESDSNYTDLQTKLLGLLNEFRNKPGPSNGADARMTTNFMERIEGILVEEVELKKRGVEELNVFIRTNGLSTPQKKRKI